MDFKDRNGIFQILEYFVDAEWILLNNCLLNVHCENRLSKLLRK